jgi:hypothetical protein
MKTSDQIDKLAGALAKAQASIKAPPKNKTAKVGSYSYTYADLSDIIEAVKKPLSDNELAWTSGTDANGHTTLHTRLIHASGQWIEASYPLIDGLSAQQMGSAITYGRRYTLCALLGIVADDDDDGQVADAPKSTTKASSKADAPVKAEPAKVDKKLVHWAGNVAKVNNVANGKWMIVGADGTEFGTSTPEHASVASDAIGKCKVKIAYMVNQNGIKVTQALEPEVKNG